MQMTDFLLYFLKIIVNVTSHLSKSANKNKN